MADSEIILRLVLSFVFGCLIGVERQWHHKNAGLKTNTLVAVGACAFSLIAGLGFGPGLNLSQVAGGVVTGIGFIGGGVILRHGGSVQGVNSAATLWATASVGLSLGLGYYHVATVVFILVLIIQFLIRWAAGKIDAWVGTSQQSYPCFLRVAATIDSIDQARTLWKEFSAKSEVSTINYREHKIDTSQMEMEVSFTICGLSTTEITSLGQSFSKIAGVIDSQCALKAALEAD
ncbi:MAG TPA: MgtC/SapB family protein [Blastocatellia bacterium]|nr:MgtC/SapB family protein [Blastocatellia bacterium]